MQVRRAVWATRQRETSEIFSGRQVHARRCSNGARGGRTKLIPLTSALNKKLLSADPIFDIFHLQKYSFAQHVRHSKNVLI
jgi:hypothetical protein